MKLFLAVDLPEEVKQKLEHQVQEFKREHAYYSWVPTKNYHITVYFLGEFDKQKVEQVQQRISDMLYDKEAFYMYSLEPGVFIDKRITVYLGFQRQKQLEEIEEAISGDLGAKHNYKYTPHLTLARWKIPSKQQYFHLKNKLDELELDIEFPVTHLTLYQSVQTSDTPTYIEVAKFPLLSKE